MDPSLDMAVISLPQYLSVGLAMRLSGGEPLLNFPALVHYPMYTDGVQYFPFRTAAMLSTLITLYVVWSHFYLLSFSTQIRFNNVKVLENN